MKRIILFIASVTLLMTACNKTEPAPTPEQYDKYIFFSHSVETKASLIKDKADLEGESFGVVGFKYPNTTDWDAYKQTTPSPSPNVFYGSEDNIVPVPVEDVTCDDKGLGSYSPLQGWSNTQTYTFFAYYPFKHSSVSLVNAASGSTSYTGGIPAVKYSVSVDNPDTPEDNEFKDSMVDLMTAQVLNDKFWKSAKQGENNITDAQGKTDLTFNFQHRLSALGLSVKNLTSGTFIVNEVSITINGLKNSDIIIPLEGNTVYKTVQNLSEQTVKLDLPENGQSFATSDAYRDVVDKLILIPQSDPVSISITINYTRTSDGYKPLSDTATITGLTTALTEGNKHMVQVYVNDYTINASITCQGWVQIPVEDSFN